eukprot:gene24437-1227_t
MADALFDTPLSAPTAPAFTDEWWQVCSFALGSRFCGSGGIDKDWPLHRRVLSGGATLLARPLTRMSDPMSGFFGLTRECYARARRRNVSS